MAALRVMTFNLRRGTAADGRHRWRFRLPVARRVLESYLPDIVGTQEGLKEQLDELAEPFPEYARVGRPRLPDDEHCAILYKPDRFRLLSHGDFWLSDTPAVAGSKTWGNYVPRMATWARFEDRQTGGAFQFWNTHLDHFAPSARRKGARLIAERLPDDEPAVLVGDFNALPSGAVYKFLTATGNGREALDGAGLYDAWRWARRAMPTRWPATFHNYTGRGLYRIDYVFVGADVSVDHAETVRLREDGRWPSDHFPVYAELGLPAAG